MRTARRGMPLEGHRPACARHEEQEGSGALRGQEAGASYAWAVSFIAHNSGQSLGIPLSKEGPFFQVVFVDRSKKCASDRSRK